MILENKNLFSILHKKLVFLLIGFYELFFINIAYAQPPGGGFPNPLEASSFIEIFMGLANWLAMTAVSLAILMIIVGGFQYLFAGGSEDKIKSANRTIYWSVIGLVIALAAWSMLRALLMILGINNEAAEVPEP